MKMSSEYSRSGMRPEYRAEFEEAAVALPSRKTWQGQAEAERARRTRKVILTQPGQSQDDHVASDTGRIVGVLLWALIIALFFPLIVMVGIARMGVAANRVGRRRRRRRW